VGQICCGNSATDTLSLYQGTDLSNLPDSVTEISLGCGNPTAIARLKPGEVVLDLGSGGGIDCFLAAKAVGANGYVIGVDMTDRMLALANQHKARMGLTNVDFRKGEIEDMPVDSNSVDVIISNCVINLSPDKPTVFREAFRVLKPGGRLAVSDVVTEGHFTAEQLANLGTWASCITGAIDQTLYIQQMEQAGFREVVVESRSPYTIDMGDEEVQAIVQDVENVRVYSARIVAYKPR